MQERPNVSAEEFLVAITLKLTCQIPSFSTKGEKGRYDIILMKQFEPKTPIETGSLIHKDEGILETTNRHTITKCNINMDDVQVS